MGIEFPFVVKDCSIRNLKASIIALLNNIEVMNSLLFTLLAVVRIAAFNSSDEAKAAADVVCTGNHDEQIGRASCRERVSPRV